MSHAKYGRMLLGRLLLACLFLVALSLALPLKAFAYDQAVEVKLPVEVLVSGDVPENPESFEVVLEAVDEGAPMPEGVLEGRTSILVEGGAAGVFPAISYDKPGIWHYVVSQLAGASEFGTYDSTQYRVTVSITNDENGNLASTVAVHVEGSEQKCEMVFSNSYEVPEKPEVEEPEKKPGALPVTGDGVPFGMILGVAAIAAIAAAGALVMKRRQS